MYEVQCSNLKINLRLHVIIVYKNDYSYLQLQSNLYIKATQATQGNLKMWPLSAVALYRR
jgi:hypothetical protein